MNNIFMREEYLNKIRGFYHSDIIKVVTGIRRCGKSFFLLSVIKDLKVKGASSTIKRGTTIKNIKLTSKDSEVECKINGVGTVVLKCEFLKKI